MAQTNNAQQNNEIRYLNPPTVEVRKKKYCRFKKAGIKYHMVEQDSVPEGEDPFDCLATSYKNVMARYGADFE